LIFPIRTRSFEKLNGLILRNPLKKQLRIAGQHPTPSVSADQEKGTKDPAQRKKEFIRRRRHQADQQTSSKMIQVT